MEACFAQRHDLDASPTAFTVRERGCCTDNDTTDQARCDSDHDSACVADAACGARGVDAEPRSRLEATFSPEVQASLRTEDSGERLPRTPPLRRSRAPRASTPPCTAAPTHHMPCSIKLRHRIAKAQSRPTWSLSVVNRTPLILLFENC
jgi:hypothetical protein